MSKSSPAGAVPPAAAPVVSPETALAKGQALFLELCGYRKPRETVDRMIERGAKLAGMPFQRARELYYGRTRHFLAHELMQLGARVQRERERQMRILEQVEAMRAKGLPLPSIAATLMNEGRPIASALPEGAFGEVWAEVLGIPARCLVVACLSATVLSAVVDHAPDTRGSRRGGNGLVKIERVEGGAGAGGKNPLRLTGLKGVPFGFGPKHAWAV